MPWTSQLAELDVKDVRKSCSHCQKLKLFSEFYRQGERYESLCKCCKQKKRIERRAYKTISQPIDNSNTDVEKSTSSYEDLGFSKETFFELVDFYRELIRLDEKRRMK